jgi:YHS domain-containing protein
VLLTPEGLRAGGRDGPVLEPGKDGQSELVRRLQLPLADDDHMPPEDKPQLLPPELATLQAWLRGGAPFGASSVQAPRAAPSAPDEPLPPAADPAALAALRDALVHVEPLEPGSTLLWIDVAAVAPTLDDAKVAALLAPLAAQVAELSLARAKVSDALLPQLSLLPRLQRLDLRDTLVSSAGLRGLAGHARLAELVLVRCKLDDSAVDALAALPALSRVHLWGAGLSPEALARLRAARPGLEVDADESAEAPPLEQEPPISLGAPLPKPVNMTCPVSGKPVDPAYQIVHEGRVIGFCCPHCPAQFWADPAKFKDKLP